MRKDRKEKSERNGNRRKEGEERRSIELYEFTECVKALKTTSFIRKKCETIEKKRRLRQANMHRLTTPKLPVRFAQKKKSWTTLVWE